MTIRTKEPYVPDEFPPARLFLDDIEEIIRILREFLETRKMDSRSTVEDLKMSLKFSSAGKECDDLEDLPKIAKSNREFTISLTKGDWPQQTLRFHPWLGTMWLSSGLNTEDTWSAFHKLEAIFKKRPRRWSSMLRSIPWWQVWTLWFAAMWSPPFLAPQLHNLMPHLTVGGITLLLYTIIVTAAIIGLRHTTIVFRHSWAPSPLRQELLQKLPLIIITSALTFLLTLLGFYLKHKYWP